MADARYEKAREAYAAYTRDDEDHDEVYNRRIKAATAMWLLDKGEDQAAERFLADLDPKP